MREACVSLKSELCKFRGSSSGGVRAVGIQSAGTVRWIHTVVSKRRGCAAREVCRNSASRSETEMWRYDFAPERGWPRRCGRTGCHCSPFDQNGCGIFAVAAKATRLCSSDGERQHRSLKRINGSGDILGHDGLVRVVADPALAAQKEHRDWGRGDDRHAVVAGSAPDRHG